MDTTDAYQEMHQVAGSETEILGAAYSMYL